MKNKLINNISKEKVYYAIPDRYLPIIKNNKIPFIIDHKKYYCIISMQQLYKLFPNSNSIKIKYSCGQCNKMYITDCQSITRKLLNTDNHLLCPKCSRRYSLYKYSDNNIAISKQQKYFFDLLKNKYTLNDSQIIMNYPMSTLYLDIALPEQNISIEYNGGGHDLSTKYAGMTKNEFIKKEWRRKYFLRQQGWKIIYIISHTDKINRYTTDDYIKILTYARYLLKQEDFVEIYLDTDIVLTKTKIILINDIITLRAVNKNTILKIKTMRIFSIKAAEQYLHISHKTIYKLYKNKTLVMNITPYNFRYYTEEQLNLYLQQHSIAGQEYLLTSEAAKYLHTTVDKIRLLHFAKELSPYVINQEYYYFKPQLDKIISNNILNNYFNLVESAKYLNISTQTLSNLISTYNIKVYYTINNIKLYTKTQLNYLVTVANTYFYTLNNLSTITKLPLQLLQTIYTEIQPPHIIIDNTIYIFKTQIERMLLKSQYIISIKQFAQRCNKSTETINKLLIKPFIFGQYKFYTQEQLDEYIAKQQYISSLYTRKQAAEYLHMSLATLDRKKETGELVPVEKGYLYSKEQLDKYMTDNGIDINNTYLSLNEVFDKYSAKYNFSKRQLKRLIENGKVATKMIARKYYIAQNDIEQYLQSLQIDEKYMSRSDILAKYNITKGQLRYAVENKKIGIIKQGSKMLYNSDDVLIYTNMLCARDNNQYLNTEESLKYLNINAKSLYSLQELNILLPDCQKLHRKYYSLSTLDNFLKNKDNILINIQNAYQLIRNSKCNNINELINKCDHLNSVVIQRFTYIKCEDFFNIINPYIPMHRIDNNMHQFYMQNNICPIYYQNQCYILEYQYIHLRNKLIKQLVTILSLYNKNKTIFMLQQYNNLYTTKQAAIYLNISQSKLYYLLQTHKIFSIKTTDNTYITFDELQRYKNENNSNGLISFNEALKYLHISHNTLEKKLKQFNIPIVKIINNKRFFSKKDIDGLL